jgi:hypothetical protein
MGPYQKIIELVTVTPDDGAVASAMVAAMLIGMRLLYGAWPWEGRKTWYRTKQFAPVPMAPAPNSEATETLVDTKDDHFDRELGQAKPNRKRKKGQSSKKEAAETLVDTENDQLDRKQAPPELTREATETPVDTENDQFDRTLMAARLMSAGVEPTRP